MKLIPLTQGQFAQVDDWNYDWLNQWKWFAQKDKKTYYAKRETYPMGKRVTIAMHTQIMNTPKGMEVDHIDHNGLNCLEENMRNCTHLQNSWNRVPRGKSPYLGVYIINKGGRERIVSRINIDNRLIQLGTFSIEEEAAKIYDEAAKKYFGDFANLNFKENAPTIIRTGK